MGAVQFSASNIIFMACTRLQLVFILIIVVNVRIIIITTTIIKSNYYFVNSIIIIYLLSWSHSLVEWTLCRKCKIFWRKIWIHILVLLLCINQYCLFRIHHCSSILLWRNVMKESYAKNLAHNESETSNRVDDDDDYDAWANFCALSKYYNHTDSATLTWNQIQQNSEVP